MAFHRLMAFGKFFREELSYALVFQEAVEHLPDSALDRQARRLRDLEGRIKCWSGGLLDLTGKLRIKARLSRT